MKVRKVLAKIVTNTLTSLPIFPGQKIKVFISSICGVEKYDKVRGDLKSAIESTQLAEVYTFESRGASTLSAESHYTWDGHWKIVIFAFS